MAFFSHNLALCSFFFFSRNVKEMYVANKVPQGFCQFFLKSCGLLQEGFD